MGLMSARVAKHPIHPMLVVFPLGLWVAALVFDIIYAVTGQPTMRTVAFWNVGAGVIDLKGYQGWSFPLIVVGMNSIAMYCMAHLFDHFIRDNLKIHLGQQVFDLFGTPYAPIVERIAVLLVLWLILLWMYSRKIFLRI